MTRRTPSPPTPDADERPVYRSYFDLLEEKYGDGPKERGDSDDSPSAADARADVGSDAGALGSGPAPLIRPRRAPGRRKGGWAWIVVALLLAAGLVAGALFLGTSEPHSSTDLEGGSAVSEVGASEAAVPTSIEELVEAGSRPPAVSEPAALPEPATAEPLDPRSREASIVEDPEPVVPDLLSADDPVEARDPVEVAETSVTPPPPARPAPSRTPPPPPPPPPPLPPPTSSERAPSSTPPAPDPEPALDDEMVVADSPIMALPSVPPKKIFAPQPVYPEGARQAGEQGTVVLRGTVTALGDVRRAEVLRGASPSLDRAALEAFRTWQFSPASREGTAVESSYRVAFHFNLEAPTVEAPEPPTLPTSPELAAEDAVSPAPSAPAEEISLPLPFGGDFDPPERLYAPLPKYPQSAWATGVSGDVVLQVVVNERGTIDGIDVLQGLPHGITEAAVERVQRWRFTPAQKDGEAVKVYHRLRLRFTP